MKLKVLQENLSKALTATNRFTSVKAQLPVLANVLLTAANSKLTISATNLEISVSLTVGAKVEKKGEVTIPSRTITDIVNNLSPGQVSLAAEKEQLKITSNNFKSVLAGMNPSDFPNIPQNITGKRLRLPQDKLSAALEKVLFAVSVDETRPVLTGVLLILGKSGLELVATDGFRLSQKKIKLNGGSGMEAGKIILPKSSLSELVRLSAQEREVKMSFKKAENQVLFGFSDSVLSSRIIDGEFPDYQKIIPREFKYEIGIDREELSQAVKLASVFAREAANVVKLTVGNGFVEVRAESSKSGEQSTKVDAHVKTDLKKDQLTVAFNYRFLEEFLSVTDGDDVVIKLFDSSSPGVFEDTKDKELLHLIMPVKIQD